MRKLLTLLLSVCGCSTSQKATLGGLCLASLVGCQTTPGMTLSWSFTLPPSLNSTATLHPVAAMPATAYAVEYPTQALIQRPYLIQQQPQGPPSPPPLPRPAAEPIPIMPRPNGPCGLAPMPSATVAQAETP